MWSSLGSSVRPLAREHHIRWRAGRSPESHTSRAARTRVARNTARQLKKATGVGPGFGPGVGPGVGPGAGVGAGLGLIEVLKTMIGIPRIRRTTPNARPSINLFEKLIAWKREAALANRLGLVASI